MQVDRDASLLCAVETYAGETVVGSSAQESCLTIEHIAVIEGLIQYMTNEGHMQTLTDSCSALLQRRRPNHSRAGSDHI